MVMSLAVVKEQRCYHTMTKRAWMLDVVERRLDSLI